MSACHCRRRPFDHLSQGRQPDKVDPTPGCFCASKFQTSATVEYLVCCDQTYTVFARP